MSTAALGIFDIFAYSIPGSVYLALLLYVLDRTSLLDAGRVLAGNTTLATVGALLASYLLGHVTYLPRRFIDQRLGRWVRVRPGARAEFERRVPQAVGRRFLEVDPFLLLRAVELEAGESATEITRLRATGTAMRNVAFALLLAAVVAAVELVVGGHRALAAAALVTFPAAAYSALRAGFTLSHWATLRTFEVAFWLPTIDDRLADPEQE